MMRKGEYSGRPFDLGWRPAGAAVAAVRRAHRTNPAVTAAVAVADNLTVAAGGLVVAAAVRVGWIASAIATLVVLVAAARAQRGLEVLVHEGAHGNACRSRRRVNDLVVDVLAGSVVLQAVRRYRTVHRLHHTRFATPYDPDRRRYVELGLDELDRRTLRGYAVGILRRLPASWRSWWSTGATPRTAALRLVAGVGGFQVLPAYLVGGGAGAVSCVAVAAVAMVVVTPVIRFVGEADEHDYLRASTVIDATFTNVGLLQRLLVHPHGDGLHQLHHLLPGVPHHRLGRLHRHLVRLDPFGYGAAVRSAPRGRDAVERLAVTA